MNSIRIFPDAGANAEAGLSLCLMPAWVIDASPLPDGTDNFVGSPAGIDFDPIIPGNLDQVFCHKRRNTTGINSSQ